MTSDEELTRQIERSNAGLWRSLQAERSRSARCADLTDDQSVILDRIVAAWNDDRAERGLEDLSRSQVLAKILQAFAELVEVSTDL